MLNNGYRAISYFFNVITSYSIHYTKLYDGLANWTQLSDLGFSAAVSGYGRSNEFQSDQLGLEYAAAAGYDTGQLHHFFA